MAAVPRQGGVEAKERHGGQSPWRVCWWEKCRQLLFYSVRYRDECGDVEHR